MKLIQGIHTFRSEVYPKERQLYVMLSGGQSPETLIITCSDSRIDPTRITSSYPGELFLIRNAGNLVPPYGTAAGSGELATIEYAVSVLNVKNIVVCGHSDCGAVSAMLHPEKLKDLPSVSAWLAHMERTRRVIHDNYSHLGPEQLLEIAIQENILVQLEHVMMHPAVSSRMLRGDLKLYGWYFEIHSAKVYGYDVTEGQFGEIETTTGELPMTRHRWLDGMTNEEKKAQKANSAPPAPGH
jgi:carbonic anhydrase